MQVLGYTIMVMSAFKNPLLVDPSDPTHHHIPFFHCCCLFVAFRMVDAVGLSRLPHACGGLHKPRGRPASHALPGSTRTDEVRNQNPFRVQLASLKKLFILL